MATEGVFLSITQIAAEFGVSRDTVRKAIAEAGVVPTGKGQRGHALYRLRDVRRAIDGSRTPGDMNAFEARAFWGAKEKQIVVETLERRRIPLEEIERFVGELVAAQSTSALVDEVERATTVTDPRLLSALEAALAPWALRRYEAFVRVCRCYGLPLEIAARALPDGYHVPSETDEADDESHA